LVVRSKAFERDADGCTFNGGMLKRAPSVLADKTDSSKWRVGGAASPVDVIVAANNEKAVANRADELSGSAATAGLVTAYRETTRRLDEREHFGFRDGISSRGCSGTPTAQLAPVISCSVIRRKPVQIRSGPLSIQGISPTTALC
jgi:hypothetical protein